MEMSDYKYVHLGEIAEFKNGVNFSKTNFGSGIKIINVKDFQDYSVPRYDSLDEINPKGIVKDTDTLYNGDVIFVRSNGNKELIGRSLYIDNLTEKVTNSAFTIRVRFTTTAVLPQFYAYVFKTDIIRHVLSSQGNGTNISNLNQQILSHLEVPLPDMEFQTKFINVILNYDNLIENNNRRIAILEEMAQKLYREWFVNFRFPGHKKVQMVESELGLIPDGWEIKPVKEIVLRNKKGAVYTGKDVCESGTIPVIDQSTAEVLGYHNYSADLIATVDSPIAIFGDHTCKMQLLVRPFSIGPNVIAFTCNNAHQLAFIYFAIMHLIETKEYKRHWNDFMIKQIVVPTAYLEKEFAQSISPMLNQIEFLKEKNINPRKTRDLLLPRLISGDIDISKLEIPVREE